ncbi:cytochrome P450 [Durotheca rogersii]|uniref:cytochrome P450 n=1 Tax=Durotheca rogersii TaxID=419775 RepID=UPI00221EA959|nr:cytochrome P450 [Durotheca rogersii]KAI5863340.1 cytochrome P450 [Durotheca rogersii]
MTYHLPLVVPAVGFFALLLLNILVRLIRLATGRQHLSPPPGPRRLPLIGNLHQLVQSHPWLEFHRWSKTYGPVMYLDMLGQPIVVLSTYAAAQDLLSKRGARYSDRPRSIFFNDLATRGMHLAAQPYDDTFRLHQRLHAPLLNPSAAARYRTLQDIESTQLLADLLAGYDRDGEKGLAPMSLFQRTAASMIYALLYGQRLHTDTEPRLIRAIQVQETFVKESAFGGHLIDLFPALNALPRALAPWKARGDRLYAAEHAHHVGNLDRGLARPGWNFSKHISRAAAAAEAEPPHGKGHLSAEAVAWNIGNIADAAFDTSATALEWFVLTWVTRGASHMAEAQRVLDRVVGRGRLPTYDDRPRLVYIDAIINETLRWRPFVTGAVAHATLKEDTYMGYRIPAGSIVAPNYWAISRDESVFGPDADSFVPERWLAAAAPDEPEAQRGDEEKEARVLLRDLPLTLFGFGRRICTGRHVARNGLFIAAARLLWAFDVELADDDDDGDAGTPEAAAARRARRVEELAAETACNNDVMFRPLPFRAVFRPRGPWVRDLLAEHRHDYEHVDLVALLDEAAIATAETQGVV